MNLKIIFLQQALLAFCCSFELESFMKILECDGTNAPICLNGGICYDFAKLNLYWAERVNMMSCFCPGSFYGPHCEYSVQATIIGRSYSRRKIETMNTSRKTRPRSRKKMPRFQL